MSAARPIRHRWKAEESIQNDVVRALALAAPDVFVVASANGAHMSALGRQLFFGALGGVAGAHDICLHWATPIGPRTAYLEIKAPPPLVRGGVSRSKRYELSDAQKAFALRLDRIGIPWARCTCTDDALAALRKWNAPLRIAQERVERAA